MGSVNSVGNSTNEYLIVGKQLIESKRPKNMPENSNSYDKEVKRYSEEYENAEKIAELTRIKIQSAQQYNTIMKGYESNGGIGEINGGIYSIIKQGMDASKELNQLCYPEYYLQDNSDIPTDKSTTSIDNLQDTVTELTPQKEVIQYSEEAESGSILDEARLRSVITSNYINQLGANSAYLNSLLSLGDSNS